MVFKSRALDQCLSPQTSTAHWVWVAQAVFQIRVEHVAAAAERTRRKRKTLHALAIRHIAGIIPQMAQTALADLADDMSANKTLALAEIGRVRMQQWNAWRNASIPANRH